MLGALRRRTGSFRAAIADELQAVRSEGGNRISLSQRSYSGSDGYGTHYYRFRTATEVGLPDDSPIEVRVGDVGVTGSLMSVDGFRITVCLSAELPPPIGASEVLITDPTFLLEGLKERLAEVAENSYAYNPSLALRLVDPNALAGQANVYTAAHFEELNREQNNAVLAAYNQSLTYVWGPPGTGKTYTLATMLAGFLDQGMDVLLLAHSNVAVDTVVYALARRPEMQSFIKEERIIRSGYPRLDELKQLDHVVGTRVAERRIPGLTQIRQQIDKACKAIEKKMAAGTASAKERRDLGEARRVRRRTMQRILEKEREVVREASLVATTLSRSAIADMFYARRYDAVVVDEASMAYIPHVFWAACLATDKLIVAGDFRQLGPVVKSNSARAHRWLKQDVFTAAGLVDKLDSHVTDERLVGLRKQYRMNPAISRLIHMVYGGRLIDGPNTKLDQDEIAAKAPFSGNIVTLVDTSGLPSGCRTAQIGHSRYNESSAALAVHYAAQAHEAGVSNIGIITPFVAQSRLIYEQLINMQLDGVMASTVHRFQGSERPLIILDLTDSYPQRAPTILLSGRMGSDAMRLINVAISRAQKKLIVLADMRFFLHKLSSHSIVRWILMQMQDQYGLYDVSGNITVQPPRPYVATKRQPVAMAEQAATRTPLEQTNEFASALSDPILCQRCGQPMRLVLNRKWSNPYMRCQCGKAERADFEEFIRFVSLYDIHSDSCRLHLLPNSERRRHWLECPGCHKRYTWFQVLQTGGLLDPQVNT